MSGTGTGTGTAPVWAEVASTLRPQPVAANRRFAAAWEGGLVRRYPRDSRARGLGTRLALLRVMQCGSDASNGVARTFQALMRGSRAASRGDTPAKVGRRDQPGGVAAGGPQVGGLCADECGAILVPAVVMGPLLVGALFYVAGVGDAIVFRTELQDAADVTAFKSAVWHARGMNIVAVLNIFMSLALSVFALLRILELIALLVAAIPFATVPALAILARLISLEGSVSRAVDAALVVTKTTQNAVVVAVPYAAAVAAKTTPTAADSVWPFSLALIPPAVDQRLDFEPRSPDFAPAALPVQDDSFGRLCGKAATLPGRQIGRFLGSVLGDVSEYLGSTPSAVVGAAQRAFESGDGVLCQPLSQGATRIASLLGVLFSGARQRETCSKVDENLRNAGRPVPGPDQAGQNPQAGQSQRSDRAPPPEEVTRARSTSRRAGCGGSAGGSNGARGGARRRGQGLTVDGNLDTPPAKVWDLASNGNLFLQTWSHVSATPRLFLADTDGISFAGGGRDPGVEPSESANAEAEYYFDCAGPWSDDACGLDALWAPNWTARVRRYRGPIEQTLAQFPRYGADLLATVQEGLGRGPGAFAAEQLGRAVPGASGLAGFIEAQINQIGFLNDIFGAAEAALGEISDRFGLAALLDPTNVVDERRIH